MASETSTTSSQTHPVLISSDSDEELIRSDYSAKNISGKKARLLMAPSSTRKRREVPSYDEEESVVRTKTATNADTDFVEEKNETDGTPDGAAPNKTSSSKKKRHMYLSSDSEGSKEEKSNDCTPGMPLINRSEAKKIKRQLALGQSTGQSSDCEGPLSPNKALMDHHSSADECEDICQGEVLQVKDGDFVASRYLNEDKTHNLYCLEGKQLNLFMMLKNSKRFIATGKFVPVCGDVISSVDYIGPIPVIHCTNVEDHVVVQIENKLVDVCNTLISEKENATAKVTYTSDSESGSDETFENGVSSCTPIRRSTRKRKTASAEKIKAYTRERQRALSSSKKLSNLVEDCDNEGPLSPELTNNTSDLVEQDQEGEGDDEESESDSDMNDFIVDDSQSDGQEVTAALGALKKPTKKEAFKRLVQFILSNHLESGFLSSLEDDQDSYIYFDQAKEVIEKLIESKKNLVGSTAWSQSGFKDMLENCRFLESETLPDIIKDTTCEACQLHPRNLKECMLFYEDCDGEKVTPPAREFSVGRFCADRGSIYHDLHYHDLELKRSCADKINTVREAMEIQSNGGIVEYCINDEEWLKSLFQTFETLLNTADEWAVDGKKRKHMKAYCAGFH